MTEVMTGFMAWAVGVGLGAIFFGGLWWTLARAVTSERPVVWFAGSFVVRTGLTLSGFYLVSNGRWEPLLLCMLGFLMARVVAIRLTRPSKDRNRASAGEPRHAS